MQNEMNQGDKTKPLFLNSVAKWIACEQALRGTLAGGEGKACNYVSGIWIPAPLISLWLRVDWAVWFQPISTKRKRVRMWTKCWKTRAQGNDVITNVISANQHFLMQMFKFQRHSCKLSFLFPPQCQSSPESLLAGYRLNDFCTKVYLYPTFPLSPPPRPPRIRSAINLLVVPIKW